MPRSYKPAIGTRCKLRLFEQYTKLKMKHGTKEPHVWAWFRVEDVDSSECLLQLYNGPEPCSERYRVPLAWIDPPLGWKPVYDIVCTDKEKAEEVISSWFKRGIHVWASHVLSSAGRKAFTPIEDGEEPGSPHWQYTGQPTESVPPELCPSVFRVVWLERCIVDKPEVKGLRAEGYTVTYIRSENLYEAELEHELYSPEPALPKDW